MIKATQCKITLPDSEGQIDYRKQFIHRIMKKFLGTATVIAKGDEIYFTGTQDQCVKIQALVDTCTEELDELVEHMLYSFFRRKNMIVSSDIQLTVKQIA